MEDHKLELIVSHEERWNKIALNAMNDGINFRDEAAYWGIRIADAFVVGRMSFDRLIERAGRYTALFVEVDQISNDGFENLGPDDWGEAVVRQMAFLSFEDGLNRVIGESHHQAHLDNYRQRRRLLNSPVNIGLGRLEARDLHLDNMWYDEGES